MQPNRRSPEMVEQSAASVAVRQAFGRQTAEA
jgi:hypothetical protein